MNGQTNDTDPWYRHRWPWILILLPAMVIAASMVTLWLAITRPDHIVVDEQQYQQIRSEMRDPAATGTDSGGTDERP